MSLEIYQAVREKLEPYKYRPVEFAKDVFNVTLDEWQEEMLQNVNDNQKVAVAGATGLGKGFGSALLIWWFISTKVEIDEHGLLKMPKLMVTGPEEGVLKNGVWAQLSELYRKSPLMQLLFKVTAEKIYMKGAEREWFCVLKTTSARYSGNGNAQAESLQGFHAAWTFTLIDEGSGLARANLEAILGSAINEQRKIVMTFNPLRDDGYPYLIYNDKRYGESWKKMNVSFYEVPRLCNDPKAVAERESWIKMYGLNSAYVQARVYGQFPTAATTNRIFTIQEVMDARKRNDEIEDDDTQLTQIGVDISRFGTDETVYYVRRGRKSLEMVYESKTSMPQVVGRCVELAQKWCPEGKDPKKHVAFVIDEVGMGGGPVDFLFEQGWVVAGVHNGSSPTMPEEYRILIDELWMEDGKDAIRDCGMVDDDILAQQLLSRTYCFTGKSKQRRISTKDEMKAKKLESPDRADAFILAFTDPDKLYLRSHNIRSTIDFF
jgi:hypothetical protein